MGLTSTAARPGLSGVTEAKKFMKDLDTARWRGAPWQYTSNSVVVVIVTCTFVCFNKKLATKCTFTDLTKKSF